MKLLIASDIHGDLDSLVKLFEIFTDENCDKLLLLGDLIYHGPRNDLPPSYNPKGVIEELNKRKDLIIAVRGNCDTEVDQMVLDFPIMSDYALLSLDLLSVYATHGHKHGIDSPPPLCEGDILLCGHTHIPGFTPFGKNNICLNPGSISIPKGGFPKTYMIYEDRCFTIRDFSAATLFVKKF